MSDDDPRDGDEPRPLVRFRSGHALEHKKDDDGESLAIVTSEGQCVLEIDMTEAGPRLKLSGVALEIAADSTLALRAGHLDVRAGSASVDIAGDLVEKVGGNAVRKAEGAIEEVGHSVAVEAYSGGVNIRANDDVDVKGERVRLNSDDPPMPISWDEYRRRHLGGDGDGQT